MYAPYFGLTREPFSIAPDPRYLFMSERHREALAHLLYGLGGGGGFVLLTGEIGTGKTTVCRCFLEQMPKDCNVAYIFNPKLTVPELLQSICDEFHIEVPQPLRQAQDGRGLPTVKDYLDPLNEFLLREHAAGRNNLLIIDEAQNLSAEVLEQLRLLTNLETSERKLLQIVLIGQPELRTLLARPELEQLAQRVIARYHLDALTEEETGQYVRHRLEVAGLARALPFERKALRRIHQLSRGVPRRINLLCDRALLGAFAGSEPAVTRAIVDKAAEEVFGSRAQAAQAFAWKRSAALLGLGLAAGAALVAASRLGDPRPAPEPAAAATAPLAPADTAGVPAPQPAASAAVAATPAPAAAPAPAQPPVLLRSEREAWAELGQSWNLAEPSGEPCQAFAREQVQCYARSTSLALIRQLGRPGIVTLDRDTGTPSYALLTALTDHSATLRAGGTEQTVTLAALASRWQGDFATLWRAPAGYTPRKPDPAVAQWVASKLPPETAAAPLAQRIKTFQLAQGLPADGQLGPLTFMQLNRAAGVEEPRLRTEP
ncbi:MAG TPA: AAA family ATPase [Ramlibacter sp.]|nr:AAA family ATPase [Ramlibacter sp.]